jgi:hypothetical protein
MVSQDSKRSGCMLDGLYDCVQYYDVARHAVVAILLVHNCAA